MSSTIPINPFSHLPYGMVYTKGQFDNCSYEELTQCVKERVKWIREYRKFMADQNVGQYEHLRTMILMRRLRDKKEIRSLLYMRRIIKKNGLKNWDAYMQREATLRS